MRSRQGSWPSAVSPQLTALALRGGPARREGRHRRHSSSGTSPRSPRSAPDTLGPAGYGYVQVSPPPEHIQGGQWWTSYQPVSYKIAGRLGDRAAFKNMVNTCHAAGVKVIADAVINHMAAGPAPAPAARSYTKYDYPGCTRPRLRRLHRADITNYTNRGNVQNCELVGLADLDTGEDYVRATIAGYLNDLLVARRRRLPHRRRQAHPAARPRHHQGQADATRASTGSRRPSTARARPSSPTEYTGNGDVQEFRYGRDLKRVFNRREPRLPEELRRGLGLHGQRQGPASSSTTTTPSATAPPSTTRTAPTTPWPTSSCWPGRTARRTSTPATSSATRTPARPTAAR